MYSELKEIIGQAWENRELLREESVRQAVRQTVELVDKGELRTAQPVDPEKSQWQGNEWVKKAIILYFPIQPMRKMEAGELEWYDKMELKHGYEQLGVRAVPHAVARYGAYIAPGAILMPSYVNIGAYVDTGTMVDTWATVGSCAQIGKHVHLSGGVGIGGVLEPLVFKKPRVGIIPSGTEIVPLTEAREEDLCAGRCLPEFNSYIFSAIVQEAGGEAFTLPIVPDDPEAISAAIDAAIDQGLSTAQWPGRLELLRRSPDFIVDGAHNPQCADALMDSLSSLYGDKKLIFLTGVLRDKDWQQMLRRALPLAKAFVVITPPSARALDENELAAWLNAQGVPAIPAADTDDGVRRALAMAGKDDAICSWGSLYFTGEVRHALSEQ